MLLIAYPELNFWFHAGTGLAWLRDEDSSDTSVLFHSLTPDAVKRVPDEVRDLIHLEVAAAYNNFGATEEEKDLPMLSVDFQERPDQPPPADLPQWFLAVRADGKPGLWVIHPNSPAFALWVDAPQPNRVIHSGEVPNKTLIFEAYRFAGEQAPTRAPL